MAIDFRQVAAPSFGDSNTLVALAARQQEQAMAGIQGAWTGAMDAVQTTVQGELEGMANKASFKQLIDPVQRQALDQKLMAANQNSLNMGDVNKLNKYVDARRGVQFDLYTNIENESRTAKQEVDRVAALELQTANDLRNNNVMDATFLATDAEQQIAAATTEEAKAIIRASLGQSLGGFNLSPADLAKVNIGVQKQTQEARVNNLKEQVAALGPNVTQAQIDAIYQGIDSSKIGDALDVRESVNNMGAASPATTAAQKEATAAGVPGAINKTGGIDYNVLKQTFNNSIAAAERESKAGTTDGMTFDEYTTKNAKVIEEQGLGTFMRSTDLKQLQSHYRWAEKNGAPYTEQEKIMGLQGLMSGSIKLDIFGTGAKPFDQSIDSIKIGKAFKEQLAPMITRSSNTTSLAAGQAALDGPLKFLTGKGQSPDQIVTGLGIVSESHPQYKYLPKNYQAAVRALKVQTVDNPLYRGTTQDPKKKVTPTSPSNLAALTPPPVVKAVNTKTSTSSKQWGTNTNLVSPTSGQIIYRDKVTPQMAKEANVKMSNGRVVMENRWKGMEMDTPYGESITINNTQDLERFISIKYSGRVKEIDNLIANNGKAKYKYPSNLNKIDPNHPLANKESDNPKNFVPYDARNYDGSRKFKTKYASYDSYVKNTLSKQVAKSRK